jgi:hypothetical protein
VQVTVKRMGSEEIVVEINVDGRNIPLNRFVQKIVSSIIIGMVSSLRDVNNWKGATITVKRKIN